MNDYRDSRRITPIVLAAAVLAVAAAERRKEPATTVTTSKGGAGGASLNEEPRSEPHPRQRFDNDPVRNRKVRRAASRKQWYK